VGFFSVNGVAAQNRGNVTKTPVLGVQGRSWSSMFIPPESTSAVLAMISSSLPVCVYLQPFSCQISRL